MYLEFYSPALLNFLWKGTKTDTIFRRKSGMDCSIKTLLSAVSIMMLRICSFISKSLKKKKLKTTPSSNICVEILIVCCTFYFPKNTQQLLCVWPRSRGPDGETVEQLPVQNQFLELKVFCSPQPQKAGCIILQNLALCKRVCVCVFRKACWS